MVNGQNCWTQEGSTDVKKKRDVCLESARGCAYGGWALGHKKAAKPLQETTAIRFNQ